MIDLISFNKSPKTTWIKKYLDNSNSGKWKIFFDMALKTFGGQNFFSCNLNIRDTLETITTSDAFLKEILDIWAEVNFDSKMTSKDQFFCQPLWHNSLIKITTKPVFFKDWSTKGIIMVKHLLGPDNNTFLSLKDFRSKYGFDPPPLSFYGLISAVKSLQTKSNFQDLQDTNYVHEQLSTKLLQVQKATTLIYKKLINNKSATPESS